MLRSDEKLRASDASRRSTALPHRERNVSRLWSAAVSAADGLALQRASLNARKRSIAAALAFQIWNQAPDSRAAVRTGCGSAGGVGGGETAPSIPD